jgi:LacI family transcriptional regulator
VRPRGHGESLARYTAGNIPVIALFNAGGAFADLPTITPAFNEPAKALTEHLKELGHKRVAILRGDERAVAATAIIEALKAQSIAVEQVERSDARGMSDTVAALMAKKQRPTVIVAADPDTRRLVGACEAAGIRVPEDVSIVSINEVQSEAYHRKHALSSVTIDPQRMGRAAGGTMLAWLGGSRPADKVRVQAAGFFPRASTGPAPVKAR